MSTMIAVPELGPSTENAKLMRWLKGPGDLVRRGDIVAEIETDKATMDVEAEVDGRIVEILVPEGTVGLRHEQRLAVLGSAEAPAVDVPSDENDADADTPPSVLPWRLFASPLARKVARGEGVDLTTVTGTGPKGRILVNDVKRAMQSSISLPEPKSTPVPPPAEGVLIPHSGMRATIARRLTQSKTEIPHFYLKATVRAEALLAFRERLNGLLAADGGERVSLNDIIVKAAAIAHRRVPEMNVIYTTEGLVRQAAVDIGIAVAATDGLVTPVLRNAGAKGLADIARETRDLADRGRQRKLRPAELEGGALSVSNLGMFGVEEFTAIINPPQSAILAVAAIERQPVVDGDEIRIGTVMRVTLSVDHRAIDGALAGRWLAVFKRLLEEPAGFAL